MDLIHYDIQHPSPSFGKRELFDDLVIIGTHVRIMGTPRLSNDNKENHNTPEECEKQRKLS
jgi:hypothetical protein